MLRSRCLILGAHTDSVVQNTRGITVDIQNVKMKAVCLIDMLVLTARVRTGVEQRIDQLAIVADAPIPCRTVGKIEINNMRVLRVGVNNPLERLCAVAVLSLADHYTGVWAEGVSAHAVDDLKVVVVVAAAIAEGICGDIAGWCQVALAAEGDVEAHQAVAGVDRACCNLSDDET